MGESITVTQQSQPMPAGGPIDKRLTVFARNPDEMRAAQASLVQWCAGKLAELHAEADDLRKNHEIAIQAKINTTGIGRQIQRTRKRVEFYEKVRAALEAGYCIVPNFPIDVFAVRTTRDAPKHDVVTRRDGWRAAVPPQQSERPALGEGQFVSPRTDNALHQDEVEESGKTVTVSHAWATEFRDVDFPFAFAHPAILDATRQALVDRVFDELGVSPARQRPKGDPMVIGRIYAPAPRWAREQKSVSFVVAWFLRPERDLNF